MKKLLLILIALFTVASSLGFAQVQSIKGKVSDENGDGLPGATLLVQETRLYAITENDGSFVLNATNGQNVTVSFLGYDDYSFVVEGNIHNIRLTPSAATMLEEAVAIGYGTTTKKEVTGSVTSLKTDDFDKGSYLTPAGMLQGKVAGLSITNPNGADPTGSYEILLRGTNTLSAGQGPLIIIDGVVGADLRNINFQEVESVDVLKDGSAAAIYGTRGTNGVIIITTKRAKVGITSIVYDGLVSIQSVRSRATPMTAEEFKYTIENYKPSASSSLYGAETDWFKEITRTPVSHKHNLAIAGGSENFSHRTVLNVEQNQGLLRGNDFNKYLFRTNIRQNALNGWLNLDYNLSYTKRKYEGARWGIFRQAFFHNPTEPVYDETDTAHGGYKTVQSMDYYNPVAMLNERTSITDASSMGVNGRATLNILPIKGLKWDNFLSFSEERYENRDYKTRYYPEEWGNEGTAGISNSYSDDLQWESTLQYNNQFGKHSVQAMLGYTYQTESYKQSYMGNFGYDTDYFKTDDIGAGSALKNGVADMDSYREGNKYIAFFGRIMYNYDQRYLVSLSLRRDGSSRFGKDNKWGWFPAVSLGWRISQESFMKSLNWLDELKLRAGYGVTGNQDFGNYKSLLLMKTSGRFYYNGTWQNAYAPASNANPNLGWEKKAEFNIGLDVSVLKGRIGASVDYYNRLTTNLLYNYAVPVPPYDYPELFTNVGTINNSGIEITLNASPVKTKNLKWDSSLIFAKNKNKLVKFTNEEFQNQEYRIGWLNTPLGAYCQRLIEGESIGTFYGPIYNGLSSGGEATVTFETMTEKNWAKLGSAYPVFTLGWSNSLTWGRFSFSATLRGSFGGKVFNQMRGLYENISELGLKNILASWLDEPEFTGKVTYSSKYLEDATYVKLDNVSIAYDIPLKDKSFTKAIRLFITGQDLFCLTSYSGVDPEVTLTGLTPGIEGTSYYPRTRMFTIGASVNF